MGGWKGGLMAENSVSLIPRVGQSQPPVTPAPQSPCTQVHMAYSLTHRSVIRNKIKNS